MIGKRHEHSVLRGEILHHQTPNLRNNLDLHRSVFPPDIYFVTITFAVFVVYNDASETPLFLGT